MTDADNPFLELAEEVVHGRTDTALKQCAEAAQLAGDLSVTVAELLAERVREVSRAVPHAESWWVRSQRAIMQLAQMPGADETLLADTLTKAIATESVMGEANAMDLEVAAWLVPRNEAFIDWMLKDDPELERIGAGMDSGGRFFFAALFSLPGPEGARWLPKLSLLSRGVLANFAYQDMAVGKLPRWSDDDWERRFTALAQAGGKRPSILTLVRMADPPPTVARPLSRLVSEHADDEVDPLMQDAVALFKAWRTGDPTLDAQLFWWNDVHRPEALRWLLELSGPPGARAHVVQAAREQGLVTTEVSDLLLGAVERPAWADGDVPWAIELEPATGEIFVRGGRLAAGDPIWGIDTDEAPVELAVPEGRYVARVFRATHPLKGRENVAAEVLIDPSASVVRWKSAPGPGDGSFWAQNGRGAIGVPHFVTSACNGGEPYDTDFKDETEVQFIERGPGSMVTFAVGPQDHEAKCWIGLDDGMRPVRLVAELGILDIDPTREPLPW